MANCINIKLFKLYVNIYCFSISLKRCKCILLFLQKQSKPLEFIAGETVEVKMLYSSIDLDAIYLIHGLNVSEYKLPEYVAKMIMKYWKKDRIGKLLKLNRRYYTYQKDWVRKVPLTELSRITCKCAIKSFTYKICVQIDNLFISIYPSIGQYRIGDSEKMIYNSGEDIDSLDLENHPKQDCSIELKLKFFKALACEKMEEHKHKESYVEIIVYHEDVFDFSGGRFKISLNNDVFTKDDFVKVYTWNGTIDYYFDVYGDKCVESWESISFYDGIWRFSR